MLSKEKYQTYLNLLKEELVPAMGCTEPISIAYAVAKTRDLLGENAVLGKLEISANIVKNAKSVTVPNTGGMKGIKPAFCAGLVCGNSDAKLETISKVTKKQIAQIKQAVKDFPLEIVVPDRCDVFDITVTLKGKENSAKVRIMRSHTNIVFMQKNNQIVYENVPPIELRSKEKTLLCVKDITEFADIVKIDDVKQILDRQIEYNMAIAEEGIRGDYGASIGKIILRSYQPDIKMTAKAYAAAGSDARMNGCDLPVIINSGSGNQGMATSIPVIVYARGLKIPNEKLYRALCISNLITLHLKAGIGTLSAYCGAVSAGAGAGCGVAYLLGGNYEDVSHTLVNALAIDSGILCDGAKASCAAKVATAVESGLLGLQMHYSGKQFFAGDGLVKENVEKTIESVSQVASTGMSETDKEIIKIMLDGDNG
ncbi:MAG: serine dehydratase subunit alpha family protein [Clostridia bacterium]|nr:serine dehydratase subunit alpha family protein [Clostridia bacterium]